MTIIAKLKALLSSPIVLGVLFAFVVTQSTATQHVHAHLVKIENCSVCLLGTNTPALTTAKLSLPKAEFFSVYLAILPTRNIVSTVTFDRLSRAPPLSLSHQET